MNDFTIISDNLQTKLKPLTGNSERPGLSLKNNTVNILMFLASVMLLTLALKPEKDKSCLSRMMAFSSGTAASKTCLSWNLHIKKTKTKK